jgi:hypothetical protein
VISLNIRVFPGMRPFLLRVSWAADQPSSRRSGLAEHDPETMAMYLTAVEGVRMPFRCGLELRGL